MKKKDRLISELKAIKKESLYEEDDHKRADDLLLAYINDKEVTEAWKAIEKWFA